MPTDYHYLADIMTALPEIPKGSILSHSLHKDEDVKVTLFSFAADQELTEHTASKPAIIHFLSGEATLSLGDDVLEAKAGTWVQMPAHLKHGIAAKTPVLMLLTMFNMSTA